MTWEDWKFSARLAWQDRYMFWVTIIRTVILVGTSVFFLWRLLPEGWRSGVLSMHYTIYLGIDEVRPWSWIFLIPACALGAALADTLISLGMYRQNALGARTLLAAGASITIVWAVGCFFLMLVNV